MHLSFFIKGIITGLAIAAPVGPTTVLVIHRTIKQSWGNGWASGLGAAVADALFAFLAGISASLVFGYLEPHYILIRLVGGSFLIYWGYRIFVSRFAESHPLVKDKGFGGPFISTFLLTLTNPMTLLAFGAVLVGLRAAGLHHHLYQLTEWMLGVCLGSLAWWLVVSAAVHATRKKFDFRVLTWTNRIMGVVVIIAACGIFLDLIKLILKR